VAEHRLRRSPLTILALSLLSQLATRVSKATPLASHWVLELGEHRGGKVRALRWCGPCQPWR
jgi:hypothetical protein